MDDWSTKGWLAIFGLLISPLIIRACLANEVTTMILFIVCLIAAAVLGIWMAVDTGKSVAQWRRNRQVSMAGKLAGAKDAPYLESPDPYHERAQTATYGNKFREDERQAMIDAETKPIPKNFGPDA